MRLGLRLQGLGFMGFRVYGLGFKGSMVPASAGCMSWRNWMLGRIRETLKREPFLHPLLTLLTQGPSSEGLYPQGSPPHPISYWKDRFAQSSMEARASILSGASTNPIWGFPKFGGALFGVLSIRGSYIFWGLYFLHLGPLIIVTPNSGPGFKRHWCLKQCRRCS